MDLSKLSVFNIRDLGGIKTSDNRFIKDGLFIRSGNLINVSDDDKKILDSLNIKYVIDLRSNREVENRPDTYLPRGAKYLNISAITKEMYEDLYLDIQHMDKEISEERLDLIYSKLAFNSPAYKKVIELIKNDEVPILFHCSAGKDRTGVLACIILLLLGVSEEDVIKEYMKSYEGVIKGYGKSDVPKSWLVDEKWITSTTKAIEHRYGNLDNYFKNEFNLEKQDIKKIQNRYLMEEQHMEKYILAIDQGTSSTRAIIFDKNQKPVKVSQKEIKVLFPHPSWVEQDANEIWLSTLACLAGVFEDKEIKPEQIEAIGITNQRETTIVWDKTTGLPVYNAIVWQSRQTSSITDEFKAKGLEPLIKEKTGLILDPYFSASKIKWIMDNVEGVKDNNNLLFGTVDTWLLYRLTAGKVHATDVTNASRTLLYNIHTNDWDDELIDLFGIKRSMLPEIKATSGYFGNVDPSHFFGQTCPITCLVGDQQGALFGESCFEKGEIKNTYGTGGFLLINTGDKPILSKYGLLTTVAWKIKDKINYALEGSIFVSGSLMQWLRDEMKFYDDAAKTEGLARSVESSDGVYVVPAFTGMGAPYWNQNCKGAIYGLTRGTKQEHITRASIEAMAYQSKDLVEVMQNDLNEKVKEIKVDGGASANKYLLEFQADILGIPVTKCKNSETTALGACRLAGLETGFFKMEDFKNEEALIIKPTMDEKTRNELYAKWKKAVEATLSF